MKVEYQIIKKKDNFCNDENQFVSLLETNPNYKIIKENCRLEYKKLNIEYDIKKYETKEKNEIMFIIVFSLEDEAKIEEFEKFDKSFLDFLSKFNNFSLNILWDDISRKYAECMYPQIFYIENLLRKIIYYFMGKNVGNNWTRKCFPELVSNSIKKVKDKNHIETDENILYYADFIQLNFLLFGKYSNETISQSELIEKLKNEKCDIKELINKYEDKSNWDRYFQPVVNKENLENNLNKLYCYRNLVAHNRKIRKNDKDETEFLVTNVKKILDNCLSKIDEINVPEEEKENLENMSCQIFNPLSYEIGNNVRLQSTIDSLKLNFGVNTEYMSGINSINQYLGMDSTLKSFGDSLKLNFGVNPEYMSGINSINQYLGMDSTLKSFDDSLKLNWGLNSEYMSEINSTNKYLGIDSAIKSTMDLPKINVGVDNKKNILEADSTKINQKNQTKTKKTDTKKDKNEDNL